LLVIGILFENIIKKKKKIIKYGRAKLNIFNIIYDHSETYLRGGSMKPENYNYVYFELFVCAPPPHKTFLNTPLQSLGDEHIFIVPRWPDQQ
jgi:hypothetical protein